MELQSYLLGSTEFPRLFFFHLQAGLTEFGLFLALMLLMNCVLEGLSVGKSATLLEVLVATKIAPLAGLDLRSG